MELEHSFVVPVPKSRAWDVLLDVERVAPCMPGATLDSVDGDEIRGRIKVKVGPINMTYAGTARFIERDPEAGIVVLEASGKETKGAGTASASVRSVLEDQGQETRVTVRTTLNVTGKPAQFGRGVMNEVGGKLLNIFANNLATTLAEAEGPAETDAGPADAAADAELHPAASLTGSSDSIDGLALSARAASSLHKEGIATVADLTAKTSDELLAIDGIGPASITEISAKLADRGLALGVPDAPAASAAATSAATPAGASAPAAATAPADAAHTDAAPAAQTTAAPTDTAAQTTAAPTSAAPADTAAQTSAAPTDAAPADAAAQTGAATAAKPVAAPAAGPAATGAAAATPAAHNGTRPAHTRPAEDDSLNLLKVAGLPMLKRALPVLAGVTAALLIGLRLRMRKRHG